jgi:hypothetical protein
VSRVLIIVQNLTWSHQERAYLGVYERLLGTSTRALERAGA